MNILLLTFSFNYNYGGLLQAYATVKYLESRGHTVQIPKNHPAYLVGNTSIFRGLRLRNSNPFKSVTRRLRQLQRYSRFDKFRAQLPFNTSLSSKAKIAAATSQFDAVLTGSDQTWNTKFMPTYENYFYQGFLDESVMKVSYASCFGTAQQKDTLLERAATDLKKFDHIAIRNEVSQTIVRRLTGVTPPVVVDPTLLHDFSEFRCSAEEVGSHNSIMVYALDSENFHTAEKIIAAIQKREPGIEVHFVNGEKNFSKPKWASHLINNYGPVEFLQSLQRAKYFVSDSFHGAIFAQKFARPCIIYTSGWRSERISSVMTDFDAAHLLLNSSDKAELQRVIGLVADQGERLSFSDELHEKIASSQTYLEVSLSSK